MTMDLELDNLVFFIRSVGFLFMPTFYKWMTLESDPAVVEDAKSTFLCAAASLASRFNPTIGCLRSWDQSNHLVNGVKREDMDKHFCKLLLNVTSVRTLSMTWRQWLLSTT